MTNSDTRGRRTALGMLCGVGAGAVWGLVFLAPQLVRDFTPLQITIGRYLAYGLFSAALIAPHWGRVRAVLSRRDWGVLALLALLGNSLYFILLATAVQQGGVAMASIVVGFVPVLVTVIGSFEHGAVPLRRLAPSLLLCVAGGLCIGWHAVSTSGGGQGGNSLFGLICALGALASWSWFAIVNTRALARLDRLSVHDWNLLTGLATGMQAVLLIPITLMFEPMAHDLRAWSEFVAVVVGVALLASIIGNSLWNQMSRLLPLTLVGQMILFETLFALVYGFIWEGRWPHVLEVAAFACVVVSVIACVAAHRPSGAGRG